MAILLPLRSTSAQPKSYWLSQPYHATGVSYNPSPHLAIDMVGYYNQPVYAAESGRVFAASWNGIPPSGSGWAYGGGYCIILDHFGEASRFAKTTYAHLARILVPAGAYVIRGQMIGYADSTGNSSGNHLHFAAGEATGDPRSYANWKWLDPRRYFRAHTYANGSQANGSLIGSKHLGRNTIRVNASVNLRSTAYISNNIVRTTTAATQTAYLARVAGSSFNGSSAWNRVYDPGSRRVVYVHTSLGAWVT